MTGSKTSNKVRIEGANGNRITLAEASNAQQKLLLSKVQTLDHDADGCICLDDLLNVVESEARLRTTTQWYHRLVVGLGFAVVLMFGVTLGSSILSVDLMREFTVNRGSLVGKDGTTLLVGSTDFVVVNGALQSTNASNGMSLQVVPQQPKVHNVTSKSSSRRMSDVGADGSSMGMYEVPRADFQRVIAIFKSGTVGLTVPLGSEHIAATVDSLHVHADGEQVMGTASGGKMQWISQCGAGKATCDIEVSHMRQKSREDHGVAARLLYERSSRELSRELGECGGGRPCKRCGGTVSYSASEMNAGCVAVAVRDKWSTSVYFRKHQDQCWYKGIWSHYGHFYCRENCDADSEYDIHYTCKK